jgi:hypothetical protein
MDLVNNPGQILCITKNVCQILGYKIEDLICQKVNKVMPFMFSKFHDKFLRNFIEKGTFQTLKQK